MIAVVVSCFITSSVTAADSNYVEDFTPLDEKTTIYIYRNEFLGSKVNMLLTVNGKDIGFNKGYSYFRLNIKPGDYTIDSQTAKMSSINLKVEAGRNYYIWQEAKFWGGLTGGSKLNLVDEETGRKGVLGAKHLATLDIENESAIPAMMPDGSKYLGDIKNGLPHGRGTLFNVDGGVFEGSWANGKATGHGVMTKPDGFRYEGDFLNFKMHGHGKASYPDSGIYKGDFANGQRHGNGIYQFPNGMIYEGSYSHGAETGNGKLTFVDGSYYVGEFRNSMLNGKGEVIDPNGNKLVGLFKDNNIVSAKGFNREGEFVGDFPTEKSRNSGTMKPSSNVGNAIEGLGELLLFGAIIFAAAFAGAHAHSPAYSGTQPDLDLLNTNVVTQVRPIPQFKRPDFSIIKNEKVEQEIEGRDLYDPSKRYTGTIDKSGNTSVREKYDYGGPSYKGTLDNGGSGTLKDSDGNELKVKRD